jgi:AAA15 family ATPase/GTPase
LDWISAYLLKVRIFAKNNSGYILPVVEWFMNNFLQYCQIRNFKSVQSIKMECKRVNVLIGKPNAGKSNILEALSLLGMYYSIPASPAGEFLRFHDLVRYHELSNWFYDDDLARTISINTDKTDLQIQFHPLDNMMNFMLGESELIKNISQKKITGVANIPDTYLNIAQSFKTQYATPLSLNLNADGNGYSLFPLKVDAAHSNPIKPLRYKDGHFYGGKSADFLLPPFGDNLFGVIDRSRELRMEVAELFKELGLDFVLSRKDGKFELQKNVDGIVYKYPYTGIADTFKRFIFYLAAIDSNKDSVLILEEPEVHAFPPYTKQLADRIALREENQFFLSTHSPYLLNTLIEVLGDEALAVTLVYFENYETRIHTLTPSELREVQDFSIDIFFNLDKFIGNGAPTA